MKKTTLIFTCLLIFMAATAVSAMMVEKFRYVTEKQEIHARSGECTPEKDFNAAKERLMVKEIQKRINDKLIIWKKHNPEYSVGYIDEVKMTIPTQRGDACVYIDFYYSAIKKAETGAKQTPE